MAEIDDTISEYHDALRRFARGEATGVMNMYSHGEDVLLANPFGPSVGGWDAARERLSFASSRFRDGDVTAFTELARYAVGQLVVLHETEYWMSRVADRAEVEPWVLRVTTTFRHEDDQWKVVLRHADPIADVDPHGPLRGK
jgi:ketosteroid isomerase-like protein